MPADQTHVFPNVQGGKRESLSLEGELQCMAQPHEPEDIQVDEDVFAIDHIQIIGHEKKVAK